MTCLDDALPEGSSLIEEGEHVFLLRNIWPTS